MVPGVPGAPLPRDLLTRGALSARLLLKPAECSLRPRLPISPLLRDGRSPPRTPFDAGRLGELLRGASIEERELLRTLLRPLSDEVPR